MNRKRYYLTGTLADKYITPREAETVKMFLKGHTMRTAAMEMQLSPRTIEDYLENMKRRLHCHSKAALLNTLYENGLLNFIDEI